MLADRLEQIGPDNLLVATGNVEVTRGTARLTADRVEINRATGDTVAEGRVILYDGDDRIAGQRMERLAASRYRVHRGVFTTCEDDPPTWSFRFGDADADLEELIYGTGASFWVKSFPLVPFLPFFAAPVRRERQTGFLFPVVGSSATKGSFYEQPFFWAISDSQDATLTLNFYELIGVGGSAEYRYVLSVANQGTATAFFIRETREQLHGQGHDANRGMFGLKHNWAVGPGLGFRADVNHVTDDLVFREFGDNLRQVVAQRVDSNVFLTKSWPTASLVTSLFWYQDLTTKRPVELDRLPDVRFLLARQPLPGLPGFLYEIDSSAVHFVRDVGSDGTRLDLRSRVTRPLPVFGFFTVSPFVGGRLTGYDKTVTGRRPVFDGTVTVEDTESSAQVRRLLELGSDFEARAARVYALGGRGDLDAVLHTIEPRINYTWIDGAGLDPIRLPQWTGGIDDIQQTSALNYSIVSRLRARTVAPPGTEPARWELMRVTVGNSSNLLAEQRPFGNVTGDLIIDPNRIVQFRGNASVSPYGEGLQTANTDLAVRAPARLDEPGAPSPFVASVGTRYSVPNVSFLQGALTAEVARWATARVTTNWDLRTDTFVEHRYGLDLKWQCWAFTVEFVSRVKDAVLNRSEEQFRFTVNLLGVGAPLSTSVGLGTLTGAQPGGAVK